MEYLCWINCYVQLTQEAYVCENHHAPIRVGSVVHQSDLMTFAVVIWLVERGAIHWITWRIYRGSIFLKKRVSTLNTVGSHKGGISNVVMSIEDARQALKLLKRRTSKSISSVDSVPISRIVWSCKGVKIPQGRGGDISATVTRASMRSPRCCSWFTVRLYHTRRYSVSQGQCTYSVIKQRFLSHIGHIHGKTSEYNELFFSK